MDNVVDTDNFIQDFIKHCDHVQKKDFVKGEIVTSYIAKREQFCILLSGTADLVRYDFNGNRSIIDHFGPKDLFGEVFYNITTNNELLVEAKTSCSVLFSSYEILQHKCKNNCKFHQNLVSNFYELILKKMTTLNMRVELLTKRTIREKVLGYLNLISIQELNKTFILPISLTDLADYLNVDRSAMMREIKLLKEEGFIEKIGNKIKLLIQ